MKKRTAEEFKEWQRKKSAELRSTEIKRKRRVMKWQMSKTLRMLECIEVQKAIQAQNAEHAEPVAP